MTVAAGDADIRLDRWFRRHYPGLAHGRLEKLLRTGQIRLDGARARGSTRIAAGQEIRIPPLEPEAPGGAPAPALAPDEAAFVRGLVLHLDDEVIVIDKPAGLAVQGGTKVAASVDGLLDGLRLDASERPRLVHRLDKDTSGALVVARTRRAAAALVAAFREGRVEKTYWALVAGLPKPPRGTIELPLAKKPRPGPAGTARSERVVGDAEGGRPARTDYVVVDNARGIVSWLALRPATGRTHQLRVHCQALGTPILGDRKYGGAAATSDGRPPVRRLMLHARSVTLPHPSGGRLTVTAPLDAAMREQWAFYGFDPEAATI